MIALFVWLGIVCTGDVAWATPRSATYCISYWLAFTDGATGDFLTGSSTEARGAQLRFVTSTGATTIGLLSWNGGTPGCITMSVDDASPHTVYLDQYAVVNGMAIHVYDTAGGFMSTSIKTNFTPVAGRTYAFTNGDNWTRVGPSNSLHIMAVASWALYRHNGGFPAGRDFEFRTAGCFGFLGVGSCYEYNPEIMWIAPDSSSKKYSIAHELGHAFFHWANNQDVQPAFDYNAVQGDCTPTDSVAHNFNTKEFQALAAHEGAANFYAALAFNADTSAGADCAYQSPVLVNWNANNSLSDVGIDVMIMSCEDRPVTLVANMQDYLGAYCLGSGFSNNRATEFDWMRAFWDLRTDDAIALSTIVAVWDNSNPNTWNMTGAGTGGSYPAARMSSAAAGLAIGATYSNNAADNGIDR